MRTEHRRSAHSVFLLHVHWVFVTKYRRQVFTKAILDEMQSVFERVCLEQGVQLTEFDGEADHVHLLLNYPPKLSIALLVKQLKGASSRHIRQQRYASIRQKLWGNPLWSPSYFTGSCGGAPLEVIRQYIEQQDTPH